MSFNIPLHILSDHKSCKETSGNCHNEQEGIFTAEISQNSKQHRNDKEHQPGANLQSIDYCLNFSSLVESWEWNIRDRDIQELAQRSPALLHIPNQQLLPGNMLYHILHMILPELNTPFFPANERNQEYGHRFSMLWNLPMGSLTLMYQDIGSLTVNKTLASGKTSISSL